MGKFSTILYSLGLGAGMMYFFDPERGDRRRALVRDQVISTKNDLDEFLNKAGEDLENRARGMLAETSAMFSRGDAPDWVVVERIRSEIGRVSRHPSAIEVEVQDGTAVLHGPILSDEVDRVISHTSRVKGVKNMENRLDVHDSPDDIPALQGRLQPREPKFELMQENWSPSARLLTTLGGAGLAFYGAARRGLTGTLLSLMGLGLAARGVTNLQFKRLLGMDSQQPAIDLQKAINIDAPVEELYTFWKNFENFPKFMAHVKEVKELGDGKSHWKVAGPAGVPVEWDAEITREEKNQAIAWKSLSSETIKTAGIVQFHPNPDGSTRITVRMSYNPPAGALGHTVATLFGANPKQAMDEDLMRLKSLFEHGETSVKGKKINRQELSGATGTA